MAKGGSFAKFAVRPLSQASLTLLKISVGYTFRELLEAFSVQSKLQVVLSTHSSNEPAWLYNIRQALDDLHLATRLMQPASSTACRLQGGQFPLYGKSYSEVAQYDLATETISRVVVAYFSSHEQRRYLSQIAQCQNSQNLQRSPDFWLFTAACYIGDVELLETKIRDLYDKMEYVSGVANAGVHDSDTGLLGQGERQLYHWKEALAPCLAIAVRGGHARVLHRLLGKVVEPDVGSLVFAAVEYRQVEVLELLLDLSREWADIDAICPGAVVEAAGICDQSLRWKILMLLTNNDSRKVSEHARSTVFHLACETNDLTLAKWAMKHGTVDLAWSNSEHFPKFEALSIAVVMGSHDVFRLIVDNIESFTLSKITNYEYLYGRAYGKAIKHNRLAPFLELATMHFDMCAEQAFIDAAQVEGASAMIESIIGAVDPEAMAPIRSWTSSGWAPSEHKTGKRALYFATSSLRPRNVAVLLRRGCRLANTSNSTVPLRKFYRNDERKIPACIEEDKIPALIQEVIGLHAEYGCMLQFNPQSNEFILLQ